MPLFQQLAFRYTWIDTSHLNYTEILNLPFLKNLGFLEPFRIYSILERKVQRFPFTCCPHTSTTSSIINITHRSGAFFTKPEPTLTDTSESPKVHSLAQGSLLVVYFLQVQTNV